MAKLSIAPPPRPEPSPPADWIRQAAGRAEQSAFAAGAALAALHPLAKDAEAPAHIWRCRLALSAASSLTGLSQSNLRDHWQLRKNGDDPGPSGRLYGAMRKLGQPRPLLRMSEIIQSFGMVADDPLKAAIREALALHGAPLSLAARGAALILRQDARAQGLALWMADALLARALGWELALPLLAPHVKRAEFRHATEAPDLWEKCLASAYAKAALEAHANYTDLFRRAQKLQAFAPKLRGKDADDAIAQLLREDALAAQAGRQTSDRAARRLFERLLEQGLVRELTGRSSFRLYGL